MSLLAAVAVLMFAAAGWVRDGALEWGATHPTRFVALVLLVIGASLAVQRPEAALVAAAEALPALLPAMRAATAAQLAGGGIEVSGFERQALLLVGWSPERKRMVGWSFIQSDAAAGFVAEEIEEFYLGPWADDLGPAPSPRTLPALIETAERQRAWLRRHHPDAAAGGELIAAHVDREGVTLRSVHTFA